MQLSKLFYFLTTISIIFLIIVASSEYLSYTKTENLQREKVLSTAVYNLDRKDLDLANIQYRGQKAIHCSATMIMTSSADFSQLSIINKISQN